MNCPDLLLVDDNEDDLLIAMRAMKGAGIVDRVLFMEDGRKALEYLKAVPAEKLPRAVFLDLRMPGVSGLDLLRMLRSRAETRNVPVIIVSSTRDEEEIENCYRLGANSFVAKNYESTPPGNFYCQAAEYWLRLNEVG